MIFNNPKLANALYAHTKSILKLAVPIIGTRLLGALLNVIPMWMFAQLGEQAMAAGAIISSVITVVMMISISLISSTGIFVARAFGANNFSEIGSLVRSTLIICVIVGLLATLLLWNIGSLLLYLGQEPALVSESVSYLRNFSLGVIPSLWFITFIQFSLGIGKPRFVIIWNVIFIPFLLLSGYGLLYGKFNLPRLGAAGVGLANALMYWLICLVVVVHLVQRKYHTKFKLFDDWRRINFKQLKYMLGFGSFVSIQVCAEFSALFFATIIMGKFGAAALASRQILLQISALVLMIPFGLSQANMLLISQTQGAIGKFNHANLSVQKIYYCTLFLSSLLSLSIALLFCAFPMYVINIFLSNDSTATVAIVQTTKLFLQLAALSYLFDVYRIIAVGSLRSIGDTLASMLVSVVLNFVIALALGYGLSFYFEIGVLGVPISFVICNIIGAIILMTRFHHYTRVKTANIQINTKLSVTESIS
jgi:MATE family multidrug resistance protein